jgi:hypothetical protein
MRAILFFWALFLCIALGAPQGYAADKGPVEHIPGTSVEMPYLIAPIEADGQLIAYAYVSSQIIASSPATAIDIRNKVPFIQDAYVRDVNDTPIGTSADSASLNRDALTARLLAIAKRVVGADKATAVHLIQVQMTLMRPGT